MEQQERGKLKIFLGFAAGVGKTYAMLEDAHTLKKSGVDVVAGYIEPHGRPDTTALKEGLEELPPLKVAYKGIYLIELDLDACLDRHPDVLLVDELAHTNVEGMRHSKRYQDIEELLEAGITVHTTVNIQHLESLNDRVSAITKIKVRERIPDSVFDLADQVEIVDIEPDDLIKRLKAGKVYKESQALMALEHFFAREKLVALREISLRRMADRVNYLEQEKEPGKKRQYFVGEHILTCVSSSPTNAKVIRTASRLAYAFHGEFTAIYVETPEMQNAGRDEKKRIEDNLQLARDLGAKVSIIYGEEIASRIAEYAVLGNVSKIVIGRNQRKPFMIKPMGTLSEQLTKYAPHIDIYVIPDGEAKNQRKKLHKKRETTSKGDGLRTAFLLLICTLIGELFARVGLSESTIIMVYIVGVLLCAMYTNGRIWSVAASICSVLLYNFFFTNPYYSLNAYGRDYPVTFLVMLVTAFLTSSLASKMRRQNRELVKKTYRTELLLENSRKLRRAKSMEEVLEEIAGQTRKLLNLSVLIYAGQQGKIVGPKLYPRKGIEEAALKECATVEERGVAAWVFKNHHRAGACTSTLSGAKAMYLPVEDHETVYAVLGIVLEERREIPAFEYGLLNAMCNEAALVLSHYTKPVFKD